MVSGADSSYSAAASPEPRGIAGAHLNQVLLDTLPNLNVEVVLTDTVQHGSPGRLRPSVRISL